MKKITKHLISFAIISLLVLPIMASAAETVADPFGVEKTNTAISETLGDANKDPREVASRIITLVLGFLSLIAVVIVLIGGFKWMTAAGNEDKVEEAKKILGAGIIGLFIILVAWGLSSWIITTIFDNVVSGA